jgi:hypothetical protein
MVDPRLTDLAFLRIMRGLVETGRAPHYAVLGRPPQGGARAAPPPML